MNTNRIGVGDPALSGWLKQQPGTLSRPRQRVNPELRVNRPRPPVKALKVWKSEGEVSSMSDSSLDVAQLSARISALEKATRRWKMGGLFLFLLLVTAALLTGFNVYAQRSTAHYVPKAVAAHEFILMGPHGHPLGRLAVVKGKPALQFYNSDGQLWWYAPPKMIVEGVKSK